MLGAESRKGNQMQSGDFENTSRSLVEVRVFSIVGFHVLPSSNTIYSVACRARDQGPVIPSGRDVDVPLAFTQSLTDSEGGQG